MSSPAFTIQDDFPPVDYDQWRQLAEASLNGAPFEKKLVSRTYEGIELQPLYTRANLTGGPDGSGLPGQRPFVRGANAAGNTAAGWDLRQEYATPQPAKVASAALADLEGGVRSLQLVLDAAAKRGLDPDHAADIAGTGGVMAYSVDDLDVALEGVDLELAGVGLDPGAAFLPAAVQLAALWQRRGTPAGQVQGTFGADPLGTLAREGSLPTPVGDALAQMADLAAWTSANYPRVKSVVVDTSIYHHAGADAAINNAFAMSTAVAYLRAMTDAGMSVDDAAGQILFKVRVGTHHFMSIVKLRAGRRLWSRVVEACGGSPEAGGMHVHAQLSDRVLTRRDPYVNLLRNTVGVFAAAVAGAEVITSVPFDAALGEPNDFSRRVARNTALILEAESHLHRVVDPAGGSWFLENVTDDLAHKSWAVFQEVERNGGMLACFESGWAAERIAESFAPRAKDIAKRKEGITGVSEFPNLEEEKLDRPAPNPTALREEASSRVASSRDDSLAVDLSGENKTAAAIEAAGRGATIGQLAAALGFHNTATTVGPIQEISLAGPFEALRDATDQRQEATGKRPAVFLANLGSVAHHTARATYSKNFFEAGGFEVVANDGFDDADQAAAAFAGSGASIAVICSSDKLYPEAVPAAAAKLKQAGARTVILAGRPGDHEDAWRAAGVDRFIYMSCNVLGTLEDLLQEEGVLAS
ncbi:MAG: methylmalonyl-CoA mutase family protein [Planctomycetota bacterium]